MSLRVSVRAGAALAPWRRAAWSALLSTPLLAIAPGASLAGAEAVVKAADLPQAAALAQAATLDQAAALDQAATFAQTGAPTRSAPSDPAPPPRVMARPDLPVAPELGSGFRPLPAARGSRFMAATANPLATDAAWQVLAEGGTAVDAVVAAQMMLTLVEPQSSGIGGGAFLLAYDAATGSVVAWDGRETAPMAADERLFSDESGRPMPFFSAVVGGRSVGVPGVVRMLEAAHREAGRKPWAELLQPAIDRALDGFAVSPRLHALISADPFLRDDPAAAAHFHDAAGEPLAVGATLRNPQLAGTLQMLARDGSRPLYSGDLANAIVEKVRGHPRNPGLLTRSDLAAYQPKRRAPVCGPWQRWIVCGMPPPSAGGIAVAQMLGILAALPFSGLTTPVPVNAPGPAPGQVPALDPAGVHLFSEAGRLAFADRDRYVADTDFVPLPAGLLDPGYLGRRATLVGERSLGLAKPGNPDGIQRSAGDGTAGYVEGGTSHISVVDSHGNAAAMTTSIENAFGSRQMVAGFLLNNQLTDFSFAPAATSTSTSAAAPVAGGGTAAPAARTSAALVDGVRNRLQPGKRPRSSMAPTLVFEQAATGSGAAPRLGRLVMVTGSPGGSAIINYVAKTLVATLQDGIDPLEAIALPNIGSRNGPTELERGRVADGLVEALKARAHPLRQVEATSGVQSIVWRCEADTASDRGAAAASDSARAAGCAWIGAADPRREGTARGG